MAAEPPSRDLRVLVVDLDPQANLSQAYMGNAYRHFLVNHQPSIVEVFDGYRPPAGPRTSTTPLDPEDVVHNVYSDGTLAYIPSRFDFSDNPVRAVKPDPKVLSHYIADHFQDRDLVLIDCPPTCSAWSSTTGSATAATTVVRKNDGPCRRFIEEASNNDWHVFGHQVPHSRGFPKQMRGDRNYGGNPWRLRLFAE